MASSAVGKRRARPQGKEAALTAARGPAWNGLPRHMSEKEYAEAKAALEARVPALDAAQICEFLSCLDSLPSYGDVELRAVLLSEMLTGGDAGGGEGASSSGAAS